MNAGDLKLKEREAREEIFRLKLKLRTNQLDNPSNYRRARKELARIMTLLRQKIGPARARTAPHGRRGAMRERVKQRVASWSRPRRPRPW